MINIRFKSNVDFSNDNELIPMTNSQEFKIDGQLVPDFLPPLDILDVWDGKNIVVQQTMWDHWFFDVNMSSSQMKMLNLILLSEDIVIEDTVNNLSATLDTSNSEYNLIEKSELLNETLNYRVIARFRSNPIVINRYEPTDQINYINVNGTLYYTQNTVIANVADSILNTIKSNNGIDKASTSDFKNTLLFVFYTNAADRNTFKEDFETTNSDDITCYNGATYQLLENRIVQSDPLGNDFYKLTATCVIDANRLYFN